MASNKMVKCKNCGEEIAAIAQVCPKCGVKVKKPFYKRGWFIALCVVVVIAAVASSGGEKSAPAGGTSGDVSAAGSASVAAPVEQEIVYTVCTVDEMMDMLNANAMKAENTYNDQYVEVTGRLGNIDSDGKYITLYPVKDQWAFLGVRCDLTNDTQKQQVMDMSIDDKVTVRGKITSVGEVLGFDLDINEIVK